MVQVGYPGGQRLAWYDRYPQGTQLEYLAGGVAPHAFTTRASYTTPTGKKAMIMSAFAQLIRQTAAGPEGLAYIRLGFASGSVINLVLFNNTPGVTEHEAVGQCGILNAAQGATIITADPSTGGTMAYYATMNLMEFDA